MRFSFAFLTLGKELGIGILIVRGLDVAVTLYFIRTANVNSSPVLCTQREKKYIVMATVQVATLYEFCV